VLPCRAKPLWAALCGTAARHESANVVLCRGFSYGHPLTISLQRSSDHRSDRPFSIIDIIPHFWLELGVKRGEPVGGVRHLGRREGKPVSRHHYDSNWVRRGRDAGRGLGVGVMRREERLQRLVGWADPSDITSLLPSPPTHPRLNFSTNSGNCPKCSSSKYPPLAIPPSGTLS